MQCDAAVTGGQAKLARTASELRQPHRPSSVRLRGCRASAQISRPDGRRSSDRWSKHFEREIEAAMHMIAHRPRNTDAPERHSACSRAATLTAWPCRSVPSGMVSPISMPTRKQLGRRENSWLDQQAALRLESKPAAAPSQRSSLRRRCCRMRSAASRRQVCTTCRHAGGLPVRSGPGGGHAVARGCPRGQDRSDGYSRPCRRTARRSVSLSRHPMSLSLTRGGFPARGSLRPRVATGEGLLQLRLR